MRKLLLWLVLAGAVVLTVLVVLSLVRAPFDPLRMAKRKLFPNKVYEARIQLTLARQLDDTALEQLLTEENLLLDSDEFLAPLAKDLNLAAQWKLSGESQAVQALRERCELRRGELPMTVVLVARDKEQAAAGKLIDALGKAYMARKQAAGPPPGEGFNGGS